MEYQTVIEYDPTPVPKPDAKGARRAASFCAFATIAENVIAYAVVIAFSFLMRGAAMSDRAYDNLFLIFNVVAVDLIAMPLAWLLLLRRVPKNASPEIEERTPLSFRRLLFFFPCAYLLMLVGAMTGKLVGGMLGGNLSDAVGDTIGTVDPWVTLLCAVIVGPIAEELFFRKAMIDRMSAFHPTDAIIFSALLFGLTHGNLTQFLYAFPLGILFGIIYYRTQNIRYTILLHIAVNAVGGLLPQLIMQLAQGLPDMLGSLVKIMYSQLILGLCIPGIIFLIRKRREFLPIPSRIPRFRRPFYINAGFIVACVVFTVLFVLAEVDLTALFAVN